MCGIIAYIGKQNGVPIVINGLKRLEYRGYDSWGIAVKENNKIKIHKQVGRIGNFDLQKELPNFSSNICIGHTRWATHGGVTKKNAHPHYSCNKNIAVVHNGIIENYQELKKGLEKSGHKFKSETDTEVIAHLIEKFLGDSPRAAKGTVPKQANLVEATRLALRQLQGNYAIAVFSASDNILIGARKGSPLILGLGTSHLGGERGANSSEVFYGRQSPYNEYFIASDIPAFINHTKEAVYLDEEEMVVLTNNAWKILSIANGKLKRKKIEKITWDAIQAQKGGYEHYLIKEINDQPKVIAATGLITEKEIKPALEMIEKARNIYIIACGTAMCAGMGGQYLFSQINGRQAHLISAAEFTYFNNLLSAHDLVICVSQSGETADVMEAVKAAKQKKAKVLALVNVMGSSLMRTADFSILTKAGPEICVLSTKAYSAQVATLFLLANALKGKLPASQAVLKKAAKAVEKILEPKNLAKIKKIARSIAKAQSLYIIGRGLNYPTALEAAIKIKEVSYIHAEGFAGGDLKHGPIALIEAGVPAIVFTASDNSQHEIISNAMEIRARGGLIIGIGPNNNEVFHHFVEVPDMPEISPILNVVPAQVLAYYLALKRGTDPDKPRNLAKSVTVK